MPKLSKSTLEKRFTCSYCGKTTRTLQGLMGHIQWRHTIKQPFSMADIASIGRRAKNLESAWKKAGLSESRSKAQAQIVARWASIMAVCDTLNIMPNNQDFKNYLIGSLTRMYENEELREKLISSFKSLLEEYK